MSSDSHLSEGLLHHSLKTTGKLIDESGANSKDGARFTTIVEFFLTVSALLTFVGVGAVNVLFRKNPSLKGWDIFYFVSSAVIFAGLGITGLLEAKNIANTDKSDTVFVFGLLYITLAITILVKGLGHIMNGKPKNYSSVLTMLAKEDWHQDKIRYWGEPLLILIIAGVCTAFYEPAGIPLAFCSISVWAHYAKDKIRGKHTQHEELEKVNKSAHNSDNYHYVQ